MTTSIFVRSYEKDFPWLAYCLRSIHKFATGFQEVVVAVPEGDTAPELQDERLVRVPDYGVEGYMGQQISKLLADKYTDADNILFTDSDSVFHRGFEPEAFITNGRVNWLRTPWGKAREEERRAWGKPMEKCIGRKPEWEYMRRQPFMIPSWALSAFRDFIQSKHGVTMDRYVSSQPGRQFSEYNCLAMYLDNYHHDKINWLDESKDKVPRRVVKQYWSWGGLKPEIEKEIRDLLR